jgi:UDP-N-acetylmuramoylalanine--D-glutamate ligase
LEISSFQLETILDSSAIDQINQDRNVLLKGFKPHIAVLLNFSQNHLDRHKDLQEYLDAKIRIFIHQDANNFAVLNDQSPHLKEAAAGLKSLVVFFDTPQDLDKKNTANPNQLAVIKVANILGISKEICLTFFETFKGVEHRMEWVRSLHGVEYINDSKATTAEAGRWALTQIHRPVVMICGGRDKNIDFSVLSELVKSKVRRMVVFGEAREKLKKTFEPVVSVEECAKLDEAVVKAQRIANEGDCVLLTPMCTSFDLFTSYEERGRVYKQIVQTLK